jgi:hypothetical protein
MDRHAWAEKRDGLMTNEVLASSGRSKRGRERDRSAGRTRAVRRGVVAVGGSPRTWQQAVRAVVLAAGHDVAASNETALRLLGGERFDSDIHVIAGLARQVTMSGVVAHRSGTIEEGDIVSRVGIACTSPLRTLIDLSGSLSERLLGGVLDDFLRRKLIRLEEVRSRVNRLRPAPGRSVVKLRRILAARIPGYDPGESTLEARIALVIDAAGLPRPTQQFKVSFGADRYRIDFAWPDRHLYLEGNGFGWHSLSSELDRDARRQNELVLDGWRPIEITWRMTNDEIERTLRRFLRSV